MLRVLYIISSRGCPSGHKTGAALRFAFSLAHAGLRGTEMSATFHDTLHTCMAGAHKTHGHLLGLLGWASSPTLAIAATAVLTPCVSEPISVIPFQLYEPIPTSSKL